MFNSNYIITITVLLVITISIYTGRIRQQTNKNPIRKKRKELHHDEKSQHCFDPLSAPNLGLGRKGKKDIMSLIELLMLDFQRLEARLWIVS